MDDQVQNGLAALGGGSPQSKGGFFVGDFKKIPVTRTLSFLGHPDKFGFTFTPFALSYDRHLKMQDALEDAQDILDEITARRKDLGRVKALKQRLPELTDELNLLADKDSVRGKELKVILEQTQGIDERIKAITEDVKQKEDHAKEKMNFFIRYLNPEVPEATKADPEVQEGEEIEPGMLVSWTLFADRERTKLQPINAKTLMQLPYPVLLMIGREVVQAAQTGKMMSEGSPDILLVTVE